MAMMIILTVVILGFIGVVVTLPLQKKSITKWQQTHSGGGMGDAFDAIWRPNVAEAKVLYELEKQIPAPSDNPDLYKDFEESKKIVLTLKS